MNKKYILPVTALALMFTCNANAQYHDENASKDSHISADVSHSKNKTPDGLHEHTGNATVNITENGKEHSSSAQGTITETAKGEYHIEADVKKLNKKQVMSMIKNASKDFKSKNKQTAQANNANTKNKNTHKHHEGKHHENKHHENKANKQTGYYNSNQPLQKNTNQPVQRNNSVNKQASQGSNNQWPQR